MMIKRTTILVYGLRQRRTSLWLVWSMVFGLFCCSCAQPLHKDKYVISGTYLEVISPHQEAGSIVYQEFKRLDKIFNFYDEESEISRLNQSLNVPFSASAELIGVLELAKEINVISNGYFDVTAGALYDFWKALIKQGGVKQLPSAEEVALLKNRCGWENVEIDRNKKVILVKKQGLKLDLSAIAKGYMVDKAAALLRQKGIDHAIVNAGGDIYCLGRNGNKLWAVGVQNPQARGIIKKQALVNHAIATSGGYEQFFELDGKKYSHLIDVKKGYPVENNLLSVSVISDTCAVADGLATAFFVMGLEGIKDFADKYPGRVKIIAVVGEGRRRRSYIFELGMG